jgi:hypothetical protein
LRIRFGNKTGYDSDAGQVIKQIPNSDYVLDPYYASPVIDGAVPTPDGVRFLTVKLPDDGKFNLQIYTQDGNNHNVEVYSSDIEGALAGTTLRPGETGSNYEFGYTEETAGSRVNANIQAQIDVVPFSDNNVIIPYKRIPVFVAILATDTFDVEKVDRDLLTFGKTGDEDSLKGCLRGLIDANRDGAADLLCYFYSDKTGLGMGDTEAVLRGEYEGFAFVAWDSVKVF